MIHVNNANIQADNTVSNVVIQSKDSEKNDQERIGRIQECNS